ncbi:unnamed protein product [Sphagnum jensenii]|uniref:Uncharacterized protein n=1 Tax=Sphagnum jensenii TaxID=128206 RepID=A0ABP0VIT8_9BRYO
MNTLSNSETGYRKQVEKAIQVARLQQQPTTTSSVYSQKMNGSVDSMEKSASQFGVDSSYDGDSQSYQTSQKVDDYSDIGDRFADDPKLENANINILVRPTFDLTYENQGFRATPSMSRTSEPRVWTPTTDSTLDMKRGAQSSPTTPYAQYKISIQSSKSQLNRRHHLYHHLVEHRLHRHYHIYEDHCHIDRQICHKSHNSCRHSLHHSLHP